ncbi:MAG: DUF6898 family protein [Rickettsiales bacterium]
MNYLIECIPHGRFVKVSAIDPVTGREAVVVGDARTPQHVLAQHAINKLEMLIKTKPE